MGGGNALVDFLKVCRGRIKKGEKVANGDGRISTSQSGRMNRQRL